MMSDAGYQTPDFMEKMVIATDEVTKQTDYT